jgi:hypothetical protein
MPARNRDNCVVLYSYSGSGIELEGRLELTGQAARKLLQASLNLPAPLQQQALNGSLVTAKERFRWFRLVHEWVVYLGPFVDIASLFLAFLTS